MPKLSGTARRRREAQLRLEQSNAWLQRRLQAIDASAGRAYSPDRAHSPSARQKIDREPQSAPAGHPQQHALLEAAQTCGAAALQQCMGADLSWKLILALLTLVSSSDETAPCQALTLAGIRDAEASAAVVETVVNN